MSEIRVLIVDDHQFYRDGVRLTLGAYDPELVVVGDAASGSDALALIDDLQPDVVLMDLGMPGLSGIETIRQLLARHPASAILVLTMFDDDSVFAALRAGARGYLLKQATAADLSRAIHAVHRGEAIFSPEVAERLRQYVSAPPSPERAVFPGLTPRETDILVLLTAERSTEAIAAELGVSAKTVRNYVASIFAKLRVHDRQEAAQRARDAGL